MASDDYPLVNDWWHFFAYCSNLNINELDWRRRLTPCSMSFDYSHPSQEDSSFNLHCQLPVIFSSRCCSNRSPTLTLHLYKISFLISNGMREDLHDASNPPRSIPRPQVIQQSWTQTKMQPMKRKVCCEASENIKEPFESADKIFRVGEVSAVCWLELHREPPNPEE